MVIKIILNILLKVNYKPMKRQLDSMYLPHIFSYEGIEITSLCMLFLGMFELRSLSYPVFPLTL